MVTALLHTFTFYLLPLPVFIFIRCHFTMNCAFFRACPFAMQHNVIIDFIVRVFGALTLIWSSTKGIGPSA